MLRTLPSLDVVRHEVRGHVCTGCYLRPRHSESLGPEVVRPCEVSCPLFIRLPMLRKVAILTDPMLRSRADVLRHQIDRMCDAEQGAAPVESPLSRYREDVVRTVLDLVGEI